jgi:hypothetical protein
VNGTVSGSCPMAGFGFSNSESSFSATIVFVSQSVVLFILL